MLGVLSLRLLFNQPGVTAGKSTLNFYDCLKIMNLDCIQADEFTHHGLRLSLILFCAWHF
jgi:hypothetical protein